MKTDFTKSLYNNTNGKNVPRRPSKKIKIDKKRLFIVFVCAFILFFLACTVIAKLVTPKIDLPALDNNDENSTPAMTSDDFKGRMDSRLKLIEDQESSPRSQQSSSYTPAQQSSATESPLSTQASSIPQQNVKNKVAPQAGNNNSNYQDSEPIPYNNSRKTNKSSDILMPEDMQYQGESQPKTHMATPKAVTSTVKRVPSSTKSLGLRKKIDDEPPTPEE